jgi:nitric oxide reductase NorD protein
MWLYPAENLGVPQATELAEEDQDNNLQAPPTEQKGMRKRAKRVEDSTGKGGLMLFRLENLFSWSEHVELDRQGDDSENEDASRVAEDLDEIAMSRQRMRKGGGLKLHLDLPPADVDDIPLGEGIKLPEWDYRKQRMQEDFVAGAQAAAAVRAPAQRPPVAARTTPGLRTGHAGLARFSRRASARPMRRARAVHGATAESP